VFKGMAEADSCQCSWTYFSLTMEAILITPH